MKPKDELYYFPWYVKDALADGLYASLTLEEKGLYHHCLNFSWINNGLPKDRFKVSRMLGITLEKFEILWPSIEPAWFQNGDKIFNRRQEEIRKQLETSHAKRVNAGKKRAAMLQQCSSNGVVRAYGSVSVSVSDSKKTSKTEKTSTRERAAPEGRFAEFWQKYPLRDDEDAACRAYISLVVPECEPELFACLERYLNSQMVADGIVMRGDNWLNQQYRNRWRGEWPAREPKTGAERLQDAQSRKTEESIQRWRDRAAKALETPKKSILGD